MGIYGQDWASYQDDQPDTSGLSFAFTKVTEGTGYVNPKWVLQRDHAKANGLVWGGYHYPHMGNSVQDEAEFFLGQVAWKPGDMICLDWEGYDQANQGVSRSDQAAYKDAWLKYVKAKMPYNPVGLYANEDYWLHVDTTSFYGDFLWIATAGAAPGQPGIQAGWLFHQYTDNPLDTDYCWMATGDQLRTWALSFAPVILPVPTQPAGPTRNQATVGGLTYGYGAHGTHVVVVGDALVAKGFGSHYQQGPGPDWTDADTLNYADYQRSLGYTGSDADGVPGEASLRQLLGYLPGSVPALSLSGLIEAAQTDPGAEQGHQTHPADVAEVQAALVAEGLLDGKDATWGRGSFGTETVAAYTRWQERLGYTGSDADGIPGHASLTELGSRHSFTVTD